MRNSSNSRKPKIRRPLITPRAMMAAWMGVGLLDDVVIVVVAFEGKTEEIVVVVVRVKKPPTPVTTSVGVKEGSSRAGSEGYVYPGGVGVG